ncbi:hypothetical protein [Cellulomonas sp. NS3]|uniref:hypothetical protein n=1 Tax=Cellulomonas sp. NS3 TaxID=2973977 RepID=UPI0021636395|nr:hypothetical protein [Cellulomonas sp. NS3]
MRDDHDDEDDLGPVRCARRATSDRTSFVVTSVTPELLDAVRAAGFQEGADGWAKSFPSDTPHLDEAWASFRRLLVPWLRQAARLDPVPWAEALAETADRLDAAGIDWWLTGSTALAVRGVDVAPGDVDLVVADQDAHTVGDLLLDGLVEPVAPAAWFCRWWGRAFLGARVEWVGGVGPAADEPLPRRTPTGHRSRPVTSPCVQSAQWVPGSAMVARVCGLRPRGTGPAEHAPGSCRRATPPESLEPSEPCPDSRWS